MKTTFVKETEIDRQWYVIDAADRPAGRLAVAICTLMRGKNKPVFAPHADVGDHVIVVNAERVLLTGSKEDQKVYKHFTGHPGGLREFPARHIRRTNPTRILTQAVRGMLPKTRQGRKIFRRLHVYAGSDHPHQAQQPIPIEPRI